MFLCGKGASKMRILVANTPLMYRQTLALAIHRNYPDFEVMIADPASMDGEAKRFRPHTLIRDDDGVELESPDGVVCWVGIMIDDHLKARIAIDGEVSEIHEASLDEVLSALGETAKLLSEDGVRQGLGGDSATPRPRPG
jgi:hypothetical protein